MGVGNRRNRDVVILSGHQMVGCIEKIIGGIAWIGFEILGGFDDKGVQDSNE